MAVAAHFVTHLLRLKCERAASLKTMRTCAASLTRLACKIIGHLVIRDRQSDTLCCVLRPSPIVRKTWSGSELGLAKCFAAMLLAYT